MTEKCYTRNRPVGSVGLALLAVTHKQITMVYNVDIIFLMPKKNRPMNWLSTVELTGWPNKK